MSGACKTGALSRPSESAILFAQCRMTEASQIDTRALEFSVRGADMVTIEQLNACALLFSAQYGVWGASAPLPLRGLRVRLSVSRLQQQYLFDNSCCLSLAKSADGSIVGHAFATKFEFSGVGCFSWITQLVVHSDYRNQGVASKLCQLAWDVRAVAGCGIVSSHPHAIRALEKATRRHCKPGLIDHARSLVAASHIPYLQGRKIHCKQPHNMCQVDTGFFVDHTAVNQLISSQPSRLGLGPLEEGHEFVAFTLKT